jgi:hypothetical protein
LPELEAPAAPPPEARFRGATPLSFRGAGNYTLQPVADNARVLALSPDAKRMVYAVGGKLKIVVIGQGDAISVPGRESSQVVFSPDGALVAVGDDALRVHDVESGALRMEHRVSVCALRFSANDTLLLHEKGEHATLHHVAINAGKAQAIGAARDAQACAASPGGGRWLISTDAGLVEVDGWTGRSRLIPVSKNNAVASPAADRWCKLAPVAPAEVWCERLRDGGREVIMADARYPELRFDPHGKRALVGSSVEERKGLPRHEWSLVDFESRAVHQLAGFFPASGSLPRLLPEGVLLVMGGVKGMTVFDLDSGVKHFASVPGRPLYAAYPLLGHPRRFAAGSESPEGSLSEDAYLVRIP